MRRAVVWAMDNPARFALVVVSLLAGVAALIAVTVPGSASPPKTAATAPQSSVSVASPSHSMPPASDSPEMRGVVEHFLAGYLAPTSSEKLKKLRPLATEALASGLALADPHSMPAGPVASIEPEMLGEFAATYRVRLKADVLEVSVVREAGAFRVSNVRPADQ
jgi:hypothetical protein